MLEFRRPGCIPTFPTYPSLAAHMIVWIVIVIATVALVERGYDTAAAIAIVTAAGLTASRITVRWAPRERPSTSG